MGSSPRSSCGPAGQACRRPGARHCRASISPVPVRPPGTARALPAFTFRGDLAGERRTMVRCITCGTELHPERARKYDYCTGPECQEKNLKGLTMVAVGMNKSADEFLILDERTREDLASGKYRDQRRGSFGPAAAPVAGPAAAGPSASRAGRVRPQARRPAPARAPARQPWSRSQQKLALLYNAQGLRPAEIAVKLGVSSHLVTQIILAAKNRGKS